MKKTALLLVSLMVCFQSYAIFPMQLTNNSQFSDSEIYIAIVGKRIDGTTMYYDLSANSASSVSMPALTASLNTLHKTAGDWGYADIFTTLSSIPNRTIYIDQSLSCRMFVAFRSPMYLHVHDAGGYAGADLNNPSDPNADLRWEIVEFSYDTYNVCFVNTTRVDAFQYPMGIELYGNVSAGANNAYMKRGDLKSYSATIADWQNEFGGTIYANCQVSRITKDTLGPIIMQPSKVASVKNSNEFDAYIAQIWSAFVTKTLRCNMGERGEWYGRVENDVFVMHRSTDASVVGRVGRPTTVEVIEGAGAFATGSEDDKATQAQFCGAINRGMIDVDKADSALQNWGDRASFFTRNNWNKYVAFFHDATRSFDGYTYAFCYDDTFDQSSTCATSHPDHLVVTIGGFTPTPGETVTPDKGTTDPDSGKTDGGDKDTDSDKGGTDTDKTDPDSGTTDPDSGTQNPENPEPLPKVDRTGTTDQGLQYRCCVLQQGSQVTYTFDVLNSESFTGLVPVVWDNSNGFRELLNTNTVTFDNCSEGQKLSVACKWMYAGGDTHTPYIDYTVSAATTLLDAAAAEASPRKVLRQGSLYIESDHARYTLLGTLLCK